MINFIIDGLGWYIFIPLCVLVVMIFVPDFICRAMDRNEIKILRWKVSFLHKIQAMHSFFKNIYAINHHIIKHNNTFTYVYTNE